MYVDYGVQNQRQAHNIHYILWIYMKILVVAIMGKDRGGVKNRPRSYVVLWGNTARNLTSEDCWIMEQKEKKDIWGRSILPLTSYVWAIKPVGLALPKTQLKRVLRRSFLLSKQIVRQICLLSGWIWTFQAPGGHLHTQPTGLLLNILCS